MKRVTGIGGVFFKAEDPEKLYAWYEKHLGLKCDPGGQGVSLHGGSGRHDGSGAFQEGHQVLRSQPVQLHDQLARQRSGRAAGRVEGRGRGTT